MKKEIFLLISFILTAGIFAANIKKPVASQPASAKAFEVNKPEKINKAMAGNYGFIENKGQIIDQNNQPNTAVLYLYNGNGMNVQLRQSGFSYEAIRVIAGHNSQQQDFRSENRVERGSEILDSVQVHRVDISFLNSNKQAKIISSEPAKDYINYYTTGTHVSDVPAEAIAKAGVPHVHHYQKVLYQNVYPNIDVEFLLNDIKQRGAFKYNFIIHPGGNINEIQLKFDGANTVLNDEGIISIETAMGTIEEGIPLSYQIAQDGSQQNITASFIKTASNTFGLSAKDFDPKATLVIDPLAWINTYFGGAVIDYGNGIAIDSSGNLFETGYTTSTSNIATTGAFQLIYGGSQDAYVAKFNFSGTLQWATYYGGVSSDKGIDVDLNTNNEILVVGSTTSYGLATSGSFQTSGGGSFILKLNALGLRQWCTYYEGGQPNAIEVDFNGNILIVGSTASSFNIATPGAYQTTLSFCSACLTADGYIAKFNSSGTTLIWGTYYGGTYEEYLFGLATDKLGNVYAIGNTFSTNLISSTGAYQASLGGGIDAFIVKFNSLGARKWGTYYGGSGDDFGTDIVVDSSGNVLITGYSTSTNNMATSGTFQTSNNGLSDAIIAKFDSLGVRQWGTFLGGPGNDYGNGISLDSSSNIFIVGNTFSTTGISTTGAFQPSNGGGNDAFITKFNSLGVRLWGTFFGGPGSDYGIKCASNVNGNIFFTGRTSSTSGMATSGGYQTIFGGGTYDAFIGGLTPNGVLPVKLVSFSATPTKENETQKVDCRWSTASEINNNYFTIERSQDLENFEGIGKVNGAGNSSKLLHYQFRDEDPFAKSSTSTSQPDKLYYRLRQTDFDGSSSLSEIRAVEFSKTSNEDLQLLYDHDQALLQINSINVQKVNLQLIDLKGAQLWSGNVITNEGINQIPVQAHVTSGFYLLKVQIEEQVQNFKVWMK